MTSIGNVLSDVLLLSMPSYNVVNEFSNTVHVYFTYVVSCRGGGERRENISGGVVFFD